eukprot:TRINITY_DN101340_c0_g1_i1.p1 TRINITY_DN101340_c0_g1~~TRINITY_DN101340_c0_g1_i1.p1  ORF type:complete len:120 (-),score=17.24 TRINITY_DN101340_c0_g1_i1:13-372(-)
MAMQDITVWSPSSQSQTPASSLVKKTRTLNRALAVSATRLSFFLPSSYASHASEEVPDVTLTSRLPAELLRGVPLDTVLSGFGQHWANNDADVDGFELSEPTTKLHSFISHDWNPVGSL